MKARPVAAPAGFFPESLAAAEQAAFFASEPDENLLNDRDRRYDTARRELLCSTIRRQYADVPGFEGTAAAHSLELLAREGTFTVTTGQQVHLFLGPQYVLYKIADAIQKARIYKERWPERNFVPVFWMATEDHDFDEIAVVKAFGSSFSWDRSHGGPVGRLSLEGLQPLLDELDARISDPAARPEWEELKSIYQESRNLASATRKLVHRYFGQYGLLCLDPDDEVLKQQFQQDMQAELLLGRYSKALQRGTESLAGFGVTAAATVRNPNLFVLDEAGFRRRIARVESGFRLFPGDEPMQEEKLAASLTRSPAQFSPNVLFRPLYQERILPNVAYIAGPSEYIYWCQTKDLFTEAGITTPALVRRRSFIIPDAKSLSQMEKLEIPDAWWWKSDVDFKAELLGRAGAVNPFPELRERWIRMIEETAAVLHSGRDPALKAFRNTSGELLNLLKKSANNYAESLDNHPQWSAMLRQALKIKQRYFSPSSPQERAEWSLEVLLKNKVLLNYLTSFDFGNEEISVVF
jgi:bacillithiol biosynthesis cysteine-adding enzyme BshC